RRPTHLKLKTGLAGSNGQPSLLVGHRSSAERECFCAAYAAGQPGRPPKPAVPKFTDFTDRGKHSNHVIRKKLVKPRTVVNAGGSARPNLGLRRWDDPSGLVGTEPGPGLSSS